MAVDPNHHCAVPRHQGARLLKDAVQDVHLGTDFLLQGGCSGDGLEVNLGCPRNMVRYCVPIAKGSQVCVSRCHLHSDAPLPLEGCPH